jgi:adenosine deaminase/adenosine deaminase CECR1
LLRAFVQRMPKGGDIHSHLSGAVYAEDYLRWAAADGYCVAPQGPALVKPSACGQDSSYFPASELFNRTATYNALINLWSTRNLPFAGQSGHDRIFRGLRWFF